MNLLTNIQEKVLTLVNPLISTFEPYGVSGVRIADFTSAEEVDMLVERFRDILPGAFLSIPRATYNNPNGLRVTDVTLEYALLVGIAGRWEESVRQDYIRETHDRFAQYLFLRPIPRDGIATSSVDYLRPVNWEYHYEAESSLSAFLLVFNINVRNWQINEPA